MRRDIRDYFTREFIDTLDVWASVKKWGMPYEGGWAEQPCRLMDVISEYDKMYAEWEAEQLEARR